MTLGQHKTVVSVAEIQRILQEMGPVTGGTEEPAAAAGAAQGAEPEDTTQYARGFRTRSLYAFSRATNGPASARAWPLSQALMSPWCVLRWC